MGRCGFLCVVLWDCKREPRVAARTCAGGGGRGSAVSECEGGGQLREEYESVGCHFGGVYVGASSFARACQAVRSPGWVRSELYTSQS